MTATEPDPAQQAAEEITTEELAFSPAARNACVRARAEIIRRHYAPVIEEVDTLRDKAIRYDLDMAGIAQRETEAVELVNLRAEAAALRSERASEADALKVAIQAAHAERDRWRAACNSRTSYDRITELERERDEARKQRDDHYIRQAEEQDEHSAQRAALVRERDAAREELQSIRAAIRGDTYSVDPEDCEACGEIADHPCPRHLTDVADALRAELVRVREEALGEVTAAREELTKLGPCVDCGEPLYNGGPDTYCTSCHLNLKAQRDLAREEAERLRAELEDARENVALHDQLCVEPLLADSTRTTEVEARLAAAERHIEHLSDAKDPMHGPCEECAEWWSLQPKGEGGKPE